MKVLKKMSGRQIIAFGYLLFIVLGGFLLSLPISSRSGEWTNFIDSLFTSTSAICVTGLVVFDTYLHWSLFGQILILLMIQVGGIGFMTLITMFSILLKTRIGLGQRKLLMQSAGSMKTAGVLKLVRRIVVGSAFFELLGAALLAIRFCAPESGLGVGKGIYFAVFHSISAFCNAGFDLMGGSAPFSSFTAYVHDPLVCLTLVGLIVVGGIGFLCWNDIHEHKFHVKKYSLHTKVVLAATFALIAVSTFLYWIFEKDNLFAGYTFGESLLASLFAAVTPRTAGFNTVDVGSMADSSLLLTVILMFVGGNSGSTAGGIKVTTFLVILMCVASIARNNKDVNMGKRRLPETLLHQALAIFSLCLVSICVGALLICAVQPELPLTKVLFEVTSALGTVGLTMGITGLLQPISKVVIMLLMFIGRAGIITVVFAFSEKAKSDATRFAEESILIG